MLTRIVPVALVAGLLSSCSGTSCDELPALQAERAAEQAEYQELVQSGAPPDETGPADDALHQLEQRVYELEQSCAKG